LPLFVFQEFRGRSLNAFAQALKLPERYGNARSVHETLSKRGARREDLFWLPWTSVLLPQSWSQLRLGKAALFEGPLGTCSLPWEMFCDLNDLYCFENAAGPLNPKAWDDGIYSLKNLSTKALHLTGTRDWAQGGERAPSRQPSLLNFPYSNIHLDATDPHDKIYDFLSLCEPLRA
jgi:hypothetical protein